MAKDYIFRMYDHVGQIFSYSGEIASDYFHTINSFFNLDFSAFQEIENSNFQSFKDTYGSFLGGLIMLAGIIEEEAEKKVDGIQSDIVEFLKEDLNLDLIADTVDILTQNLWNGTEIALSIPLKIINELLLEPAGFVLKILENTVSSLITDFTMSSDLTDLTLQLDSEIDQTLTEITEFQELLELLSNDDTIETTSIQTPTKTIDIAKDLPNNNVNVDSSSPVNAKEIITIIDSLLVSADRNVNINDSINQYMASIGVGDDIIVTGTSWEIIHNSAVEWTKSPTTLTGNVTLNSTDVQGIEYQLTYNQSNKQKTITTNNENMNQLGILMEEGTFDGSDVTIVSNGKTITGQQQPSGEVLAGSVSLTEAEINDLQVGFVDSVAAKAVDIAANVFGMILDPLAGLTGRKLAA